MKTIFLICTLLVATCLSGSGQIHSHEVSESERILALENAWNQAEMKGDARALDGLLGSSFVYTDADGTFMDRAKFLAHIQRSDDHYEQLANEGQVAYVNGNVAIVTGIYSERIVLKGRPTVRRGRFTDTWIRENRAWMCIASQATIIAS